MSNPELERELGSIAWTFASGMSQPGDMKLSAEQTMNAIRGLCERQHSVETDDPAKIKAVQEALEGAILELRRTTADEDIRKMVAGRLARATYVLMALGAHRFASFVQAEYVAQSTAEGVEESLPFLRRGYLDLAHHSKRKTGFRRAHPVQPRRFSDHVC